MMVCARVCARPHGCAVAPSWGLCGCADTQARRHVGVCVCGHMSAQVCEEQCVSWAIITYWQQQATLISAALLNEHDQLQQTHQTLRELKGALTLLDGPPRDNPFPPAMTLFHQPQPVALLVN